MSMTDIMLNSANIYGKVANTFSPLGRALVYALQGNLLTDLWNKLYGQLQPLQLLFKLNNYSLRTSNIASGVGAGFLALNTLNGGATNTASDVLGGLSSMASAIPGPAGAIAGAALQAASFIANGFTDTVNEEYKALKGTEIANVASLVSNAGDYKSLMSDISSMNTNVDLGDISNWGDKGLFITDAGSARRKARNEAVNALEVAGLTVQSNINNTASNINQSNINNFLSSYAADGGSINIKPSKRGTFTAAASKHNMGVQEFANKVLSNKENYSPAMVKKAVFAKNASKWLHSNGGNLYAGSYSDFMHNLPYTSSINSRYDYGGTLYPFGGEVYDLNSLNVDTRSDTTREGYNERPMSSAINNTTNPLLHPFNTLNGLVRAGIAGALGQNTLDAFTNGYRQADAGLGGTWVDTKGVQHVNPLGGIAPTPSFSKLNTFTAANGKTYVKLANGKVQSLENYQRASWGEAPNVLSAEAKAMGAKSNFLAEFFKKQDALAKLRAAKIALELADGTFATRLAEDARIQDIKSTYARNNHHSNKMLVPGGRSKYAFGGDLLTHGANFDDGFTYIGNGGRHEDNKYEGVQMGIAPDGKPNLVEEGEVVWNDYVFSDRLKHPKTGKSFAKEALKASKESEERPNDPISRNGKEDALFKLEELLELIREKKEMKNKGHLHKFGDWLKKLDWSDVGANLMRGASTIPALIGLSNPALAYSITPRNIRNVGYTPSGVLLNLLRRDRDYLSNKVRSTGAATRRALTNAANGNFGALTQALANQAYNELIALGEADMQDLVYNNQLAQTEALFRQALQEANARGLLQADMANLSADAQRALMQMTADQYNNAQLDAAYSNRMGNWLNLFGNISKIGEDILNRKDAETSYLAFLENMNKYKNASANGGKINKRRRGLTY